MLDVRIVGLSPAVVPYTEAWELQRRVHGAVVSGAPDTLLLLEHDAVFTAGARTEPAERPADGTPVIDVDRGGKITWHGPGQLVGYPIVRLPEPVDVVSHVRRLEHVLIAAVADHGVTARQIAGRSGVWVEEDGRDAKIAAIGVRVQRGVTMHGFALNCDNDLAPFRRIVPCGISDAGVTSLTSVLGRDVSPSDVVDTIVDRFRSEFRAAVAA
ncbi:lipoyl(octanoyl) transferase LipB [Microbacterium sp. cf332]|uniref:lipoyl(octanoyl) transferase LipB n=1 Tax=Microbacterium sp. cf332 TaxID=1761804 RepID=UPI000885E0EB|nr:lipoyl(octanoyl) transferase LipB [Microbacterium sp. cf332]SDQ11578.1 lipoyl(octanoyl) transferase [Microbacterium sp. cf332]